MLGVNEPVNVWVYFKNKEICPHVFFWNSRQIRIDKINLIHQSRHGQTTYYHFSVSSEGNFYCLRFDATSLRWFLEMVEEEV
ncbi:MAG: hypothetical protein US86_C0003G0049 [Candidatus Daviesbacteria bacterium GW2011_GWA2_38_24]|uniref:Uncharacterized protein n=1 Tax=Candidatus Daviesbacteria bacterium GW2011_GWA2_38_24 TaxID=1618422 RepID=A0A0G0MPH7_9BACT|nr:MAG: hypothetical protein US86_C0003G0049 [Candidatus Daviesbacteria bacterium GW2011_GWA2_38_24]KKQ80344.1 MAG: hypothetical protein UT01_C0014G0003 [Candidatus Daviesbacteria bacterium GW2011_GWA1_38_7]OGE24650.1 MAG: hypothetical protein A2688_01135 [Candidatus Daviesbacteria bacterium RIFCSPHIGHO2_01_FULL_38_8]